MYIEPKGSCWRVHLWDMLSVLSEHCVRCVQNRLYSAAGEMWPCDESGARLGIWGARGRWYEGREVCVVCSREMNECVHA